MKMLALQFSENDQYSQSAPVPHHPFFLYGDEGFCDELNASSCVVSSFPFLCS